MNIIIINRYKKELPKEYSRIYCGRPSLFGNPFPITKEQTRDKVCDQYEDYFEKEKQNPESKLIKTLQDVYKKYKDQNIALECFCSPKRCHTETIKRYLELLDRGSNHE